MENNIIDPEKENELKNEAEKENERKNEKPSIDDEIVIKRPPETIAWRKGGRKAGIKKGAKKKHAARKKKAAKRRGMMR